MDTQKTILVVDDDPKIIELLSEVLTMTGYTVITVNHPNLAAMKMENIDLVIMDLDLSGGTTFEGNKLLCQLWADTLFDTPIIIYSGYVDNEDERQSLMKITTVLGNGRNVFRCIQKGRSLKELLDAVKECFKETELNELMASA